MSKIRCQTSDNQILVVDIEILKVSSTLVDTMRMLGIGEGTKDPRIILPVPYIRMYIFKKVIEWMNHHKNDSKHTAKDMQAVMRSEFDAFDAEFFSVDKLSLLELERAGKCLDLLALVHQALKEQFNRIEKEKPELEKFAENLAALPSEDSNPQCKNV